MFSLHLTDKLIELTRSPAGPEIPLQMAKESTYKSNLVSVAELEPAHV